MDSNKRKLAVLSLISKGYLKTGEPIGSKLIVSQLGEAVSSATIRNDMAELERCGLLFQPHTSAGRIPTASGLRLYIDKLMEKRKLSKQRRDFIDSLLRDVHSVGGAISAASGLLADYSQCVSFLTLPSGNSISLKQIDFIKTGTKMIVFVLLTSADTVKSVIVRFDGEISDLALEKLAEVSKKKLTGIALCDITPPVLQTMAAGLSEYALLFSPFFEALYSAAQELSSPDVCIKGQDNLFRSASSGINAAKAIDTLHSESFFRLIEPDSGISIIIPDECDELKNVALVYSGYRLSDDLAGMVGVLGPYRIDYSSIIPMIEYFSSTLEIMLKQDENDG